MGLFDFIKDAGANIFGSKEQEEAKKKLEAEAREAHENAIKGRLAAEYVQKMGLEVDDLSIEVANNMATVRGTASDQATREKIILAVGNLKDIEQVNDLLDVYNEEAQAQFYTVQKGDSLSKIAKEYYGNAMKYPVIFDANKPMLKDPNQIYPGQVLRIPPID